MARDEITNWLSQARKFQSKGELGRAETILNQLSRAAPLQPEVHHRLALIYIATGRHPLAKASIDRALTQAPGSAAIWKTTIRFARDLADPQAISRLRAGLEAAPLPKSDRRKLRKSLDAPLRTSQRPAPSIPELRAQGKLRDALAFATAQVADFPTPANYSTLADCQRDLHLDDAALTTLETGCAAFPDDPALAERHVIHLRSLGHGAAYADALRKARETWPTNAALMLLDANAAAPSHDLPEAVAQQLEDPDLPAPSKRRLLFAQAKLAEAKGEDFPFLEHANALTRSAFPYDIGPDELDVHANQTGFSNGFRSDMEQAANPDPRPIFITGLPRSGTTLAERMLATRPGVASAGEVGWINRHIRKLLQAPRRDDDARAFARQMTSRYWTMQREKFPDATHIIDKSIPSYAYLGALKTLMPNARIIVMRRDPADTALSLFRNMFVEGRHRYTNDLEDIARFMRLFEGQLAFWRKAAPNSFTEIWYEDLVQTPLETSQALYAAAGIDWHPGSLDFHAKAGRVDTLSASQVRAPIHTGSVGLAARFGKEMEPFTTLYEKLGADRPSPDRDQPAQCL